MRIHTLTLALAAGLALTACADVKTTSGPPIAGTTAGPGSSPLTQQTRDIGGGSPNASAGTPTITGTHSSGGSRGSAPEITYSGPGTAGAGSATPVPLPTGGRREGTKGGG